MENIGQQWQKLTGHFFKRPLVERTARHELGRVDLPAPIALDLPLKACLARRRSGRAFGAGALTLEIVSNLVWAAYGVNDKRGLLNMRTAPSAGATYPLELYLIINNCQDLSPGLYLYDGPDHALVYLYDGELGAAAALALAACPIGAFFDEDVTRLLGVNGVEEFPIYALAVGNPA